MTQHTDTVRGVGTAPDVPPREPQREPVPAPSRRGRRPWWGSPWVVGFGVLTVFNLIWALPTYLTFDPALSRSPLSPDFPLHYPVVVAHALTGNVTMVAGFLQLLPWLREGNARVHRVSGWLYVYVGALPASVLGIALLPFSQAPTGRVGLFAMAVTWLVTTIIGYRMQRQHRYAKHRRWMYYSLALALGTSWGRVLIIVMGVTGIQIDMMIFLEVVNWAWLLNLLVAHWLVQRRRTRTPARSRQATAA